VLTLELHSIWGIITDMAEPLLILVPITEAYRGMSKMTIDPGAIASAIYTEVPDIVDRSEALPSVLIVMIQVAITDIGAPLLLGHETQYAKLLPEFPASQSRRSGRFREFKSLVECPSCLGAFERDTFLQLNEDELRRIHVEDHCPPCDEPEGRQRLDAIIREFESASAKLQRSANEALWTETEY